MGISFYIKINYHFIFNENLLIFSVRKRKSKHLKLASFK